jgi:hypothetical protein
MYKTARPEPSSRHERPASSRPLHIKLCLVAGAVLILSLVCRYYISLHDEVHSFAKTGNTHTEQTTAYWAAMAAVKDWITYFFLLAPALVSGQPASPTTTADRPQFTVPDSADEGQKVIPWLEDPEKVDPQEVCPGYKASGVKTTTNGVTAVLELAGEGCSVYGNDIHSLSLVVEVQTADRLHVEIKPTYIGQENETWFTLPESLIPRPVAAAEARLDQSDFTFNWTNDPTFEFTVTRKSTGDTLFTTQGLKLVYEDQFIEFGSSLPDNYNLYGLGEVVRAFRLGNNLTSMHFPPAILQQRH